MSIAQKYFKNNLNLALGREICIDRFCLAIDLCQPYERYMSLFDIFLKSCKEKRFYSCVLLMEYNLSDNAT